MEYVIDANEFGFASSEEDAAEIAEDLAEYLSDLYPEVEFVIKSDGMPDEGVDYEDYTEKHYYQDTITEIENSKDIWLKNYAR